MITETRKSQVYMDLLKAVLQDAYLETKLSKRAQKISLQKDIDYADGRMRLEGTAFFSKVLARVGNAYTRSLDGSSRFEPSGLKRYRNATVKSVLPAFAGEIFRCTHTDDGQLREDADPRMVQKIRTVLFATYKMREEFSSESLDTYRASFIACDRSLLEVEFVQDCKKAVEDEVDTLSRVNRQYRAVLREARILVHRVLQNADPMDITPSHGPGAVSEGLAPYEKPYHSDMAEPMGDVYDITYYISGSHALVDNIHEYKNDTGFNDVARVLFVPKDSRGPRVITCEPVAKQWIQQGLMRAMKQALRDSPLTRDCVVLHDQTVNQVVSALSSVLGTFASIDLKDASDRVTVELVKFLFPDNWFRCMMAARSSYYRFQKSEDIRPLIKYAGMGNATTFPTEALCFWALGQALVKQHNAACQDVYVYGDDILIDSESVKLLTGLFTYVGLKVNTDKSFVDGPFREACGYDAFKGQNVAPLRIKTLVDALNDPEGQASALSGLVEVANRTWANHPNLASFLYEQVKSLAPWVPNSDIRIPGALVFNLGHHLVDTMPVRWNKRYQRREFLVRVAMPRIVRRRRSKSAPHRWCDVLQVLVKPGLGVYKDPTADQYSVPNRSIIQVRWCPEGGNIKRLEPLLPSLETRLAHGYRYALSPFI